MKCTVIGALKLVLPDDDEAKRPPFTTDHLIHVLLDEANLKGLNPQAKAALYAFAETGAGLSEQVGLSRETIVLDCNIPHIRIEPTGKQNLKTKYRKRTIPLVGFALDAYKAFPEGFTDYKDKPDSLSAVLGKYLRENDLFPTEEHTVYSLRHSFQDRLTAINTPDRVQADLMGHKFSRPSYGDGANLAQKLEWLEKIKLSNPNP